MENSHDIVLIKKNVPENYLAKISIDKRMRQLLGLIDPSLQKIPFL